MKKVLDVVKLERKLIKGLPSLDEEFKNALKDDSFKALISTIKLNNEYLKKYTSNLKDAATEINNCKNCEGLAECKNKIIGFSYTPVLKESVLMFSYVACKYKQKELKDNFYQNNVSIFELPREIRMASMKDIYVDDKNRVPIIRFLKSFIDDFLKDQKIKGLYLHGNFGSGKTYLIAALFNELAKNNIKSAIIYWPEFLRDLKVSFNDDYSEKINYIKDVSLLLIDDIGAENTTPWGRDEILGPILQHRMQEFLPTFFTSNLNLKSLEDHFSITNNSLDKVKGRRIAERIKQLAEVKEMLGENRRK